MVYDSIKNLIFFDTETTSLKDGEILQIAWGEVKATGTYIHERYFKPMGKIDIEAMAVHHITEEMVKDNMPFMTEEFKFLEGKIAVAHNAEFDIEVMKRHEINITKHICTYKVVANLFDLPQYKLQYLRYLWDLQVSGAVAHNATGDVEVLIKVFNSLMEYAKNKFGWDDEKVINEFVEISKRPLLIRRFTFGKYKGRELLEIAKLDRGYLEWMLGQNDMSSDLKENIRLIL